MSAPADTSAATCPNCRAPMPPGDAFCMRCGAESGTVARATPAGCAGCGAALAPGARFCMRCGAPTG